MPEPTTGAKLDKRDAATVIFDELRAYLKSKGMRVPKNVWRVTVCAQTADHGFMDRGRPASAIAAVHAIDAPGGRLEFDLAHQDHCNGQCPAHCRRS